MVSGSMYRRNRDDFSVLVSLLLDFRGGKSILRADVTSPDAGPTCQRPTVTSGDPGDCARPGLPRPWAGAAAMAERAARVRPWTVGGWGRRGGPHRTRRRRSGRRWRRTRGRTRGGRTAESRAGATGRALAGPFGGVN
jgi:hypothetical protein